MSTKPQHPAVTPLSLAEEIRESKPLYIEAAVNALRKTLEVEYARLRGYAFEAKTQQIVLGVSVTCGLEPNNRYVKVESRPQFQPPVHEINVKIPR